MMKDERSSPDYDVVACGDRILVAVSGGVDSLALLHMLANRREELQIALIAAHVHHGMRGESADADVEFLRGTCEVWAVPFEVEYCDVPAMAVERGVGIEEAGRLARYEALSDLAHRHRCSQVATAHHADDQVETLLLNLLRGTGLDGLRGMPERRPLNNGPGAPELIRPLLGVWRHELEAYCREHGLEPRHDVTNDDLYYRRNRVRAELVPLLHALAPAVRQNLLRLASQVREEVAVLEPLAHQLLEHALPVEADPRLPVGVPNWLVKDRLPLLRVLEVGPLAAAPKATVRRSLRMWLRKSAEDHAEFSLETIDRVAGLIHDKGEGAVDLPDCGLRVRRKGRHLLVEEQDAARVPPRPVEIPAPGNYTLPEFGLEISLDITTRPADLCLASNQACLDAAEIEWPLCMRPPQTSDRFRPLGAPGSRLVSDLFIDRKIPAEARSLWPVLEDQAGILWVCGIAVTERTRVTPTSRDCVRMSIERWTGQADLPTGIRG